MEEETTAPTLLNHSTRWGLILGVVAIVLSVGMYAIDYRWMVQLKAVLISLIIFFAIVVYAGIDYRRSIGGLLSYGKAFLHGFLVFAISALIASLFSIVLYEIIDPELPQKLTDVALENDRIVMTVGTQEDQVEKVVDEERRARMENQFTMGGVATGYVFKLIVSAIMTLVSALIVRKTEAEMM
jgi:Protein of unknown function (DUF4199)